MRARFVSHPADIFFPAPFLFRSLLVRSSRLKVIIFDVEEIAGCGHRQSITTHGDIVIETIEAGSGPHGGRLGNEAKTKKRQLTKLVYVVTFIVGII